MMCILETEPSFVHHFLPCDRSRFHVLTIGIRSVRAVAAAFAGVLLTKILRVV
ncbi:MAG: hypothetical protein K9J06_10825 [Flavobacteriales bacterium]|nr:hypothetical protein [Flavobacteriales bacterium]